MIKPNTMCMIRGVPHNMPGADCNGKIVQVKEVVFDTVWRFEPAVYTKLHTGSSVSIDLSEERFLFPLDPCEDDLSREALDTVLENTFRETLERELEKF